MSRLMTLRERLRRHDMKYAPGSWVGYSVWSDVPKHAVHAALLRFAVAAEGIATLWYDSEGMAMNAGGLITAFEHLEEELDVAERGAA